MIKEEIYGIFPVPIYRSKLSRRFTKTELRFVEKMKTKCRPNKSNTTSSDNYILNRPSFSTLKKEIDLFIEDYFSKILFPSKSISPYITQSWLNYTKTKEHHHSHNHVNSYLSGVLYINAARTYDNIIFQQGRYTQLKFSSTQYNSYNSDSWSFPVGTGEIIIFPSYITHLVNKKQGKNTRVSLSFNVFLKGNLGEAQDLNELKL